MGFVGENKTLRGAGPRQRGHYHANCERVLTNCLVKCLLFKNQISQHQAGVLPKISIRPLEEFQQEFFFKQTNRDSTELWGLLIGFPT